VSVIGGVVVGYAVAEMVTTEDRRFLRIGLALVGGMVVWTSLLTIQSFVNPAVTFVPTDPRNYRIGLAIVVVVVALVEGAGGINKRRSSTK
jgi:hypothetical protein